MSNNDLIPTRFLKLFPGCSFKVLDKAPPYWSKCRRGCYCESGRACDVCGMTVEGSVYHCKEQDLDVHPTCAMLEEKIRVEDVKFELQKGMVKSKCNWCNRKKPEGSEDKIPGFCYVSECGEYSFHVFCLMDMEEKHRSTTLTVDQCSRKNEKKVVVSDKKLLRRNTNRGSGGGSSKFVKVVKMFLTIVLSVLFGDPTAIIASVVVHMLSS